MMTTHTSDVPTTQHTTAMMTMPTVVHLSPSDPPIPTLPCTPDSQLGLGSTASLTLPLSVPSVLDISQVYVPSSASVVSTMISSWLAAAKKWRSVTTSGLSSLVQLSLGAGLPPAMHCKTAVSPLATVRSTRGRRNDGVSVKKGKCSLFNVYKC